MPNRWSTSVSFVGPYIQWVSGIVMQRTPTGTTSVNWCANLRMCAAAAKLLCQWSAWAKFQFKCIRCERIVCCCLCSAEGHCITCRAKDAQNVLAICGQHHRSKYCHQQWPLPALARVFIRPTASLAMSVRMWKRPWMHNDPVQSLSAQRSWRRHQAHHRIHPWMLRFAIDNRTWRTQRISSHISGISYHTVRAHSIRAGGFKFD